jgi:hypothetical protein
MNKSSFQIENTQPVKKFNYLIQSRVSKSIYGFSKTINYRNFPLEFSSIYNYYFYRWMEIENVENFYSSVD